MEQSRWDAGSDARRIPLPPGLDEPSEADVGEEEADASSASLPEGWEVQYIAALSDSLLTQANRASTLLSWEKGWLKRVFEPDVPDLPFNLPSMPERASTVTAIDFEEEVIAPTAGTELPKAVAPIFERIPIETAKRSPMRLTLRSVALPRLRWSPFFRLSHALFLARSDYGD